MEGGSRVGSQGPGAKTRKGSVFCLCLPLLIYTNASLLSTSGHVIPRGNHTNKSGPGAILTMGTGAGDSLSLAQGGPDVQSQ